MFRILETIDDCLLWNRESVFAQRFSQSNRDLSVRHLMASAQSEPNIFVSIGFGLKSDADISIGRIIDHGRCFKCDDPWIDINGGTLAVDHCERFTRLRSDDRSNAGPDDCSFLCSDLGETVTEIRFMIYRDWC